MNMMNMQLFRYAVEVDRCGSISQAAEKLMMGQPNLSKAIRELETQLGVSVFRRTSRGVQSTPEGEEFLRYARSIVSQVERVEDIFGGNRQTGLRFRLSSMPSMYVSEAFASFCAQNAQEQTEKYTDLALLETQRMNVIENVSVGESDLGVLRCRMDEETTLQNLLKRCKLEAMPLWLYELRIMMSERHPLAQEKHITQKMLAAYPRVMTEVRPTEQDYLYEAELTAAPEGQRIIASGRDGVKAILAYTENAYCLVPPVRSEAILRTGCVLRAAEGNLCHYRDYLIARSGGMNMQYVRDFLEHLYAAQTEEASVGG